MFKRLALVFAGTFGLAFTTYALFGGLLFIPRDNPTSGEASVLVAFCAAVIATLVSAGALIQKDTTEHTFDFLGEAHSAIWNTVAAFPLTLSPAYIRLGASFPMALTGVVFLLMGSPNSLLPFLAMVPLWWGARSKISTQLENEIKLPAERIQGLKGLMLLADALTVIALFLSVSILSDSARILEPGRMAPILAIGLAGFSAHKIWRNPAGGVSQLKPLRLGGIALFGVLLLMAVNCFLDRQPPLQAWKVTNDECLLGLKPSPLRSEISSEEKDAKAEGCSKLLNLGPASRALGVMQVSDRPGLLGIRWRGFDPWR